MNWGYFFAWAAAIFVVFLLTGYPVTPHLKDYWGNHYEEKNLSYYSLLYIHHLLGALFFPFLILGLFRNLIWTESSGKGGNRQLAFLLAYSVLIAAAIAVYLTHRYSPVEEEQDEDNNGQQGEDNLVVEEELQVNEGKA